MKGFFRKLFNIYAGEERNALIFAFLGFLWALAVSSGLKFADALFLLHVGASSLPIVYILTACVMVVLAAFLLQAFHLFSAHRIFIAVLLFGAFFYLIAHFCLSANIGIQSKWLWFALRIFGTLFLSIIVTCFWSFLDQYYHLQDAKRLYGLFSSAIFLGIAATGFIMRSGLIDIKHLTLIIVVLLILTSLWVSKIARSIQPVYDENTFEGSGEQVDNSFHFLFKSILSSKFTMLLMASNFLIYLFLVTTEYSYMSAFDRYFDQSHISGSGGEEKAQLTLFLGQCIAGVSIINLILGLFVYSRLIRRFGISNMILCTPIFLCITFSGWLFNDSLVFPVMGFFVVEGMLYTIDDNNFTLLLNAVPHKVKYKVRLMIESFFEPIGMLISSLLIAFTPLNSVTLGLILAIAALIVALQLRKNYLKAIFKNLLENAIHFQRGIKDWFARMPAKEQRGIEKRMLALLYRGTESERLFAIEGLLGFDEESILTKLLKGAGQLSSSAKIVLINKINESRFSKDESILNWLRQLEAEAVDPQLKAVVHFNLARHGLLDSHKVLNDLQSNDLMLKSAAILSLQKPMAKSSKESFTRNRDLAAQQILLLLSSENEEEVCMGIKILGVGSHSEDVEIIMPFLNHPSLKISRHAANAIAHLSDKQSRKYADPLLLKLSLSRDTEIRQSCLIALGKLEDPSFVRTIISSSIHFRPSERRLAETIIFQMGICIVSVLLAITKDITMHVRCRVLAGRVLGKLALPELRENLYMIINLEIERAYFYFYHQHTIQKKHPNIDLSMLKDALLSSFHSVLDFIIQLLGVAGESEDCELLSCSLRSPNPKVRSHVLEALERTCETPIFRALYPLIADLPDEEKINAYLKGGRPSLSLTELLDKMSHSSMHADQIMAAALKYQLNMPDWRESLKRQMASNEEIFHHFAYELLET